MTFDESAAKIDRIMQLSFAEIDRLLQENVALRASHDELLSAAKKAKETIRIWHGRNLSRKIEPATWGLYQASPEMRFINAAIAKAEESSP